MQKLIGVNIIAACVLITGCHDSHHSNDNPSTFIGTWVSPAYGSAVVISEEKIDHYEYTSDYCIKAETEELSADYQPEDDDWRLADDKQSIRQIIDSFDIEVRDAIFYKSESLPTSCTSNLIALKGDNFYDENQARDFEFFWQTFNEYYMSFALRDLDWQAQRAELDINPVNISNDEQLFQAMVDMIEPLEDSHVSVMTENDDEVNFTHGVNLYDRITEEFVDQFGEIDSDEKYADFANYATEQLDLIDDILASYAADEEQIQQAANDELTWFITPDNIGYLQISDMIFFSSDDLEQVTYEGELNALQLGMNQAMADLAETKGLIIDVRRNGGGVDAASQMIAKYFLDKERHLYSKQARLGDSRTDLEAYRLKPVPTPYTKPVMLLTSKLSTSATEVFTLMMRELPHVTLVGEDTQGALSDVLGRHLPNGFSFDLVNEYYLTPAGEWFEGSGIPVDYEATFSTLEQRQNKTDDGMNLALQRLAIINAN